MIWILINNGDIPLIAFLSLLAIMVPPVPAPSISILFMRLKFVKFKNVTVLISSFMIENKHAYIEPVYRQTGTIFLIIVFGVKYNLGISLYLIFKLSFIDLMFSKVAFIIKCYRFTWVVKNHN